jgi:hypothetical protein
VHAPRWGVSIGTKNIRPAPDWLRELYCIVIYRSRWRTEQDIAIRPLFPIGHALA